MTNNMLKDPETCSWCVLEVENDTLNDTDEGRLCDDCFNEYEGGH